MKIIRKIDLGFSKFVTWVDEFTAIMVFALMLLITADVVSRTAFDHPFQGVAEIVSNCIIILCFLEIPFVLMKGTHVRSTMVYDKVSPRGKAVIDILACILGILVYIFIIRSSWGNFIHAASINDAEIAGTVRIPTTPGRFSVIFGSSMMVLEFLLLLVKNIVKLKDPNAFQSEAKPAEEAEFAEGGQQI